MEIGEYLRPVTDVTWIVRSRLRMSVISISIAMSVLIGTVAYLRFAQGMDSGKWGFLTAVTPIAALIVTVQMNWKPIKALRNLPILRRYEFDDGLLTQIDETGGGRRLCVDISRVPLDARTVAIVMEKAICLRSSSGEVLQLMTVAFDEFRDKSSRELFLDELGRRGVLFTTDAKALVTGRAPRR